MLAFAAPVLAPEEVVAAGAAGATVTAVAGEEVTAVARVVVTGAVAWLATGAVLLATPAAAVPNAVGTVAAEALAALKQETRAMQPSRQRSAARRAVDEAPQRVIALVGPPARFEWSHPSYLSRSHLPSESWYAESHPLETGSTSAQHKLSPPVSSLTLTWRR